MDDFELPIYYLATNSFAQGDETVFEPSNSVPLFCYFPWIIFVVFMFELINAVIF